MCIFKWYSFFNSNFYLGLLIISLALDSSISPKMLSKPPVPSRPCGVEAGAAEAVAREALPALLGRASDAARERARASRRVASGAEAARSRGSR